MTIERNILIPSLKEQRYFCARYYVTCLGYLGFVCSYCLRLSINLAILSMVKMPTNITDPNNTVTPECAVETFTNFSDNDMTVKKSEEIDSYKEGEFEWDEVTQGIILGSFFWGYICTQIPGGRIAEVYDASHVFGLSVTAQAILALLTPLAARWHYGYVIAIRVAMGLCGGPSFPAAHALLARWAPPIERAHMGTLLFTGMSSGAIVTYPFAAFLIIHLGWEAAFYMPSAITLMWGILWFLTVTAKPETFRFITHAEKTYITGAIGDNREQVRSPPIPWKSIATSIPFWTYLIAALGHDWGLAILLIDVPLYMKMVLNLNISQNALVSSMPNLSMVLVAFLASTIMFNLLKKGKISVNTVRKGSHAISYLTSGACFIGIVLAGCNTTLVTVLLISGMALQGFRFSGYTVNNIDLAPNYAGTLSGIANTVASFPGWVAPLMVGILTNNNQTREQWSKIFYSGAAIYISTTILFLIFASTKVQNWNQPPNPVKNKPTLGSHY